ncbi:MAG: hypothetical protein KDB12_12940 [Ilumatobacter sp.]|nr:hypothetical protein [Ilumatobacter sp.]
MEPVPTIDEQPPQPPQPPQPLPPGPQRPGPKVGQLTGGWGTAFWFVWAGAAGAFAAVWVSSRTIGLSTWWLGPETQARPILISLLPFVLPLALAAAALAHARYLPWFGMAGAAVQSVFGLGDLGRVEHLALAELLVAAGAFVLSAASLAGMLRPAIEPLAAEEQSVAS